MAWVIFHTFMEKQHNGAAVDLDTGGDTRCMLIKAAGAPTQATDTNMSAMQAEEVAGDNYTAGGFVCTNESIVLAAGVVTWDMDEPHWHQAAGGFTDARYAVLYAYNANYALATPICYADLGGAKVNTTGDLTLQIDPLGVFTITCS